MAGWPFKKDAARHRWSDIEAAGFASPVPGCIYEGSRLGEGVPLGGLGTGYFTLEGSGKIGHCSIYNDIVPPRVDGTDWLTISIGETRMPLSTAEIAYWGHFPIADIVADFSEKPLTVGIRAFSPFIVGDAAASNIPAALFEIEIENRGNESLQLEISVTPPSPPPGTVDQIALAGDGWIVQTDEDGLRGVRTSTIEGGATSRFRLVFAWYFLHWRDSGNEPHVHRYGTRFQSAAAVAAYALEQYDALLSRVLAWQAEIYNTDLPSWLRDALVQSLYSLAKNTVWIARTRSDEWWDQDGWFTHSESHTGCPITETMVCRMHGHFPTLFFFPELEQTTLDAFRHFQIQDGEIPFSYGLKTSMRDPRYHCQHPLNSGQYAQMVYRLYKRTHDRSQLERFYESAKRAIRYQFSLDDDGDGLVNDQAHVRPGEYWPANQFYDIWPWWGTSAYVAGTWLATLAIGRAMADEVGDAAFSAECSEWLDRGQRAYQEKLWTGTYYRLWNDLANQRASDVSLANQLMAQWCTQVVGLPGVLPEKNVLAALTTIERLNMKATSYGLVNGVTPDGSRFDTGFSKDNDHAKHTFIGESLCAAMTFMYHGRTDVGMEIAKRLYEAMALKTCSPWNQRCLISSETGLPVWGHDYYSNMVIWALPMALAREGIDQFTAEGGLVYRMIAAANGA
jgi:uncharacterized protein (DUF608 family)